METNFKKLCESNFPNICHSAYAKSVRGVKWNHIFRSLTLWTNLARTRVTAVKDVAIGRCQKPTNFQILRDGMVGLLVDYCIMYYDFNTFQQLHEQTIMDDEYRGYRENDDIIVLLNKRRQLMLRSKGNRNENADVVNNVKFFFVIENDIYYVTDTNCICKRSFNYGVFSSRTRLVQCDHTVVALGHEAGTLYIMTQGEHYHTYTISSYFSLELTPILHFGNSTEVIAAVGRYFADHIDWSNKYFPINFFSRYEFENRKKYIQIMRSYGPILFVGYKPGILCIYHSLYTSSVTDLLLRDPLKVHSLIEPHKGIINTAIYNIDVVEGIDNHTVLVATDNKVQAITFLYDIPNSPPLRCVQSAIDTLFNDLDISEEPSTSSIKSSSEQKTIVL